MEERTKLMLVWPVAGFFVVIAFGVGVIATAAYDNMAGGGGLAGAAAAQGPQRVEVELGDFFIKPETLEAPAGDVIFEVRNTGATEHNFSVGSLGATKMLQPGQSATLSLDDISPGKYAFLCQVAGHADSGMRGTLAVSGLDGAAEVAEEPGEHAGMDGMSPAAMARHDAEVTASFPAETKGLGGQALEPGIAPDGTKVFDLTAAPVRWETEPGKFIQAWAYNGMVPGPTIKADLGDRVRIVLHNELPEPTTIHHHGMEVPAAMDGVPVISQDAVMPGDSFTYEFTVRNTGSNMYHSHFNAQKQVPMGLLGAFIVADPADPKVDVDHTMVLNDGPLGFTLNGKGFPATQPIAAERGDLVRIRYMNEGLMIHPMHLHGLAQKVIARDGHLLERPFVGDTILVAPGERVDVLVKADAPGAWALHCHILNHAESSQGMFGMVTAMVVE